MKRTTKKLSAILAAWVILAALGSCQGKSAAAPEAGSAKTSYQWKLAHEESEVEMQHYYATKFKELIEASSGGRVQVDIFPVGQLGDSTNQVELLQVGGVEFAINNPGATATLIPEANVFSLHFLLPDDIHTLNRIVHEGEGIKFLNDLYYKQDMYAIDWVPTAFNVWTANNPIRTPEDFKGFKIRTMAAPVISKSYAAYGANPVAIPYMELYSSLQLKMVDGQVNPLYAVDGMKFYEVQKYMTLSFPDCFFATLCANRAYWESLPKDIQQLVAEAAAGANKYILNEKQAEIADNALQHITAQGTTVHKLTEEERAVFAEIAKRNRNVYTDLVGSTGQQLLDLLVADAQRIK